MNITSIFWIVLAIAFLIVAILVKPLREIFGLVIS